MTLPARARKLTAVFSLTGLDTVEAKQSDFGFDYYATRAALFRYSAATFNAHRIHLDPEYCRNEEGHPGKFSNHIPQIRFRPGSL